MSLSGRKRLKWLLLLVLLALVAVGVTRALSARKAKSEQLAAATAARQTGLVELAVSDVVKAQTLEIVSGLKISGALKAVNSALVKARVSGELQGLAVREGDVVKAGQVLARIDASEYQSRVRQAQNQASSARAQVEIAKRQYDNNKALVDQGFISKTGLDASLASLNAAEATYRAALAGAEISAKAVSDTVVLAPISGQVAQRLAQPGEQVNVNSSIVEIVDISRLELQASLGASESVQVRVGQTALLSVEGSPQPVTAHVVRINPSAQAGSRSVLAYLSIDNLQAANAAAGKASAASPMLLRQGLFVQGTLGTTRATLLSVPLASVRSDKPVPYIQLVENDRVVHRSVVIGERGSAGGESVVAVKGVDQAVGEGALVLRGHVGMLREGSPVRFTGTALVPDPAAAAGKSSP